MQFGVLPTYSSIGVLKYFLLTYFHISNGKESFLKDLGKHYFSYYLIFKIFKYIE